MASSQTRRMMALLNNPPVAAENGATVYLATDARSVLSKVWPFSMLCQN
jgi:hypothetical protein